MFEEFKRPSFGDRLSDARGAVKSGLYLQLIAELLCAPAALGMAAGIVILFSNIGGEPGPHLMLGLWIVLAGGLFSLTSAAFGWIAKRRDPSLRMPFMGLPVLLSLLFLLLVAMGLINGLVGVLS